jgi:hypothetical protein
MVYLQTTGANHIHWYSKYQSKNCGYRIHVLFMMYDVYWYCQMKKKEWLWKCWKRNDLYENFEKGGVVEKRGQEETKSMPHAHTYRGGQFYWRKPEYPEITTELPQVTDKLYHIIWYTSPWAWVELTTLYDVYWYCQMKKNEWKGGRRKQNPCPMRLWFANIPFILTGLYKC